MDYDASEVICSGGCGFIIEDGDRQVVLVSGEVLHIACWVFLGFNLI